MSMQIPRDPAVLALIHQAQSDDHDAMTQLLRRYAPLIRAMVDRYAPADATAEDVEDLLQEASILFCQAVVSYDTQQEDVELGLYAQICIRNGLVSLLRKHRHRCPTVPLEEMDRDIDAPSAEDPTRPLRDRENTEALCRVIEASLSPMESRIWWLYLSGRTAREIAALEKKPEKAITNAVYRIRKKLRSILPHP